MNNITISATKCKPPLKKNHGDLYRVMFRLSLKSGYCFPKVKTLSDILGVSVRTVTRWVNCLVTERKVVRGKRYPKSYYRINQYRITQIIQNKAKEAANKILRSARAIKEKSTQSLRQISSRIEKLSSSLTDTLIKNKIVKMGLNKPSPENSFKKFFRPFGGKQLIIDEEKNKQILQIYREGVYNADKSQKELIKNNIMTIKSLISEKENLVYFFCVLKNFRGEIKSSLEGYYRSVINSNYDYDKIQAVVKQTINTTLNRLNRDIESDQTESKQLERLQSREQSTENFDLDYAEFENETEEFKNDLVLKTKLEVGGFVRETSRVFRGVLIDNYRNIRGAINESN